MSYDQDCLAMYLAIIENKEAKVNANVVYACQDTPLAQMSVQFQLSELQYFIILSAYLYDTYTELMGAIYQTYQEDNLYYARILTVYGKIRSNKKQDVEEIVELKRMGILQPIHTSYYQLKQIIALQPYVLYYLHTNAAVKQQGLRIYLPKDTFYYSLYPKEEMTLTLASNITGDILLTGIKGSGKHTLLYQLSEKREESFVFINIPHYRQASYEDQQTLFLSTMFYVHLLQANICLENPQKEEIPPWREISRKLFLLSEDRVEVQAIQIQLPEHLTTSETANFLQVLLRQEVEESAQRMTPGECVRYGSLLHQGCKSAQALNLCRTHDVSAFVKELTRPYTLQDFYAEQDQMELLEHFISLITHPDHERHAESEVHTLLFYGPSGTGKTMAAAVIANETKLPLWQIDLATIIDKYIGESEKHLRQIFLAARRQHAILLFDEADVLFGKRTSISSSNDRYANSSTAFLLQEIEQYDGIILLTSNLLNNFDDAFLRRIQFIIRFVLPDEKERRKKWIQGFLSLDRLQQLPYDELAKQLDLSLAQIEAVTKQAIGFWRTSQQEQIKVTHIIKALQLEYQKQQRTLPANLLHTIAS